VGCLTVMAAVPSPPAKAILAPQSSSERIAPHAIIAFYGGPAAKSHQSRAPPRGA
jgi:hypothetical protein